jgi:hypothetical protein
MDFDDGLIDFSNLDLDLDLDLNKNNKYQKPMDTNQYKMNNGYVIEYDDDTTGYFRAIRKTHIDPIFETYVDESYAFKFDYQWDPYTGERTIKDPYGPLYFDPDSLIKYFHSMRLNNLWNAAEGDYDGFFGDALGNGPKFEIKGRGDHPEFDIFRLPIITCYLTKDNSEQNITFGPKLTDAEITEIYNLAKQKDIILKHDSYKILFAKHRPNILKLKEYWLNATNKMPRIPNLDISIYSQEDLVTIYGKFNADNVKHLKKI